MRDPVLASANRGTEGRDIGQSIRMSAAAAPGAESICISIMAALLIGAPIVGPGMMLRLILGFRVKFAVESD